jgi:uracil-DNA glycosylase
MLVCGHAKQDRVPLWVDSEKTEVGEDFEEEGMNDNATDKEKDAAAICCAPRLYRELQEIPKDVPILTLGKPAARSVLNVRSILLARGFVWTSKGSRSPAHGRHTLAW